MRRLLTLLALLSGMALAQTSNYGGVSIAGSYTSNCIPVAVTSITLQCAALVDNATNIISTEAILAPDGTALLPAYSFSGLATMGMFRGANNLVFATAAAAKFAIVNSNWQARSDGFFGFSSTTDPTAGGDLFFKRRTTANLQFGAGDVNGVPVAQTLSVQNAITGSNLAGGTTFSLAASLGTGTGTPGTLVITGGDSSVASGATAQTQITRATFNNTKALTTGAATTAVSIPLATLQMTGGTIDYYIEATDGTNQCTSKNSVQYAAENSAGVFKATVTKVIGTSVTNCTGATTLTEAWAMSGANPSLIQVTPTLTGITATRFTMIYEVHHMGNTVPTI